MGPPVLSALVVLLQACGGAGGRGVAISPSSANVAPGDVQQFTASVASAPATGVTWSVVQGAAGGTISSVGLYTAPTSQGVFQIQATSVQDPTVKGLATVNVVAGQGVTVAISPQAGNLGPGGTLQFTATVANATSTAVTWSVLEGAAGGTISSTGLYTAPATPGLYRVQAASVQDPTAKVVANVNVAAFDFVAADRLTVWNPGLAAIGGIPSRTTICKTLSPSGADDTTAIQSALDACPAGQVVLLSAGTFKFSQTISVASNKVLRGSGSGTTFLNGPNLKNGGFVGVYLGGNSGSNTAVNLTADAVKGATTVTVASIPPNLAVGKLIAVDQTDDMTLVDYGDHDGGAGGSPDWNFSRTGRSIAQVNEVAAISGNTITVSAPWHITFKVSQAAQLMGGRNTSSNAGLESLTVQYGDNNVVLADCKYCWVKDIESLNSWGVSVNLLGTFRSELRDSYIHDTQNPSPGGAGYGIGFGWASSDNLVENNISIRFNKVMVMRASGGGNVIAYNYMDDGWISYDPEWMETGINASHDKCPHYELFEGNQGFNFSGDSTWGNAVYITVFRNQFTGRRRGSGSLGTYTFQSGPNLLYYEDRTAPQAIGLMHGHMYYNFVGNVLGFAGQTPPTIRSFGGPQFTGFCYDDNVNCPAGAFPMWNLGWVPVAPYGPVDTRVSATAVRDGNFDYATNTTQWLSGAKTLPVSLYLKAKPAFFGANPWPWVAADGATKTATLPARARFDAMP